MSIVDFKVGTTFNVPIAYTPVATLAPANLANTTITSQLRKDDGTLICSFTANKAVDNMSFNLSVPSTDAWPTGINAFWDIKFVDTIFGAFFSDTTQLRLVKPQTR
jgi:hypothetical protein